MLEKIVYVVADPWGSVAEWVAGIGTVGTLVITLLIVLGDRRRQDRAEADSFTTWSEVTKSMSGPSKDEMTPKWFIKTTFYNAGGRPVPYASLSWWDGQRWNRSMAMVDRISSYIFETGQTGSAQTPISETEVLNWDDYFITFRDSSNRAWYRSPKDNRYLSDRRMKKLAKRGPKPPRVRKPKSA